jgi:hypothetical protein
MAVAGSGILVVLGPAGQLPWADGVLCLGHEADSGGLLVPTMLSPSVPMTLVEAALRRRVQAKGRLAILPNQGVVIPVDAARPIARQLLRDWLAEECHATS